MSVAWASIKRRLRASGGSVFLVVKTGAARGAPADVLADITVAIDLANAALDRGGDEPAWAAPPSQSPKGPMVHLDCNGTSDQVHEWLDAFAGALGESGWSGTVSAAPISHPPEHLERPYIWRHRLTAFAAYMLDRPTPHYPLHWYVPEALTREIGDRLMQLPPLEEASLYFSENVAEFRMDPQLDLGALFADVMRRSGRATATFLRPDEPVASRSLTLSRGGQVNLQSGDDGIDWGPHLSLLRDFLSWHPSALDAGFIRYRNGLGGDWGGLIDGPVPLPHVQEHQLRHNRPLWAEHVPDAHGLQLLTGAHLNHAADLSDWHVRKVAEERYLVEAHDLNAWFGALIPDHEVLAKARRDFGAMIITEEAIAAHPAGWSDLSPPPAT